jgi:hypothetical protein
MSKKKKKRSLNISPKKLPLPPFMVSASKAKFLGQDIKFATFKDKQNVTMARLTKSWDKMSYLEDNRDTDDGAIKRLAENIQKFGQLQPIVLNENWHIIEGQHRVKACKLLDIPVLYVESFGATIKEVIVMNNNQQSWRNKDYLKCFSHKNHRNSSEYKKIKAFFDTYGLNFSVSINLLAGYERAASSYTGSGKARKAFIEGNFKIKSLESAEKYGNQLKRLKSKVNQLVQNGKFCMAWVMMQNNIAPDSEGTFSMMMGVKQMEKNYDEFKSCKNQDSWDDAIVAAYNKGLNAKNKLTIIKRVGGS